MGLGKTLGRVKAGERPTLSVVSEETVFSVVKGRALTTRGLDSHAVREAPRFLSPGCVWQGVEEWVPVVPIIRQRPCTLDSRVWLRRARGMWSCREDGQMENGNETGSRLRMS